VRKVQPYWSTMAVDLEVFHDVDGCLEAERIPMERLHTAAEPPKARRRCTACMYLQD
jgi:hypothetical protein